MKQVLLLIGLCMGVIIANAQLRCATDSYISDEIQSGTHISPQKQEASRISNKQSDAGTLNPAEFIIPVVVHVLYNHPDQNISKAQVESQIDVLNKDFGKKNADIVNVPAVFAGLATDTKIRFSLAELDPEGKPTDGIVRKYTDVKVWKQDDQMKFTSSQGSDAWNAQDYLNIWVCNLDKSLLGYSSFPSGAPQKDGVVIRTDVFGTVNNKHPIYNKGRTTTHEVGHWLGLKHLWGDADCGDDLVDDTPPQQTYNTGCSGFPRMGAGACSKLAPNGEMYMNFMDFSDDACLIMFTQGQAARMRSLFEQGGARAGITQSKGLRAPGNNNIADVIPDETIDFVLSPNPATGSYVRLAGRTNGFTLTHITIYDYAGKRVLQFQNTTSLNIGSLPAGLYIVRIHTNNATITKKVLKK